MNIVCSRCNKEKTLDQFNAIQKYSKNKGEYIYYFPYCKKCNSEKAIESYESNREENLEYRKLHYHLNKEHYREKQREADQRNREERRDSRRKWQHNNPEKIKGYNSFKYMNKSHDISPQEWKSCKQYFDDSCAYCGIIDEDHFVMYDDEMILSDFHKEHVFHDGLNDLSNCVPACKSCNVQKRTIPFLEWYSSTNENFDQDRFDKIIKWITEDYKLYIQK